MPPGAAPNGGPSTPGAQEPAAQSPPQAQPATATLQQEQQQQQQPPTLMERALADSPEWWGFVGTMANSGTFTGTLLDGIHSRVGLQVYDFLPLKLGGLTTSAAVPVLLAVFYVVLGTLYPLADNLSPGPETDAARARSQDVFKVALSFGALAGLLLLSATLYDKGVPTWQIHAALGTATLVNWKLFDNTKQGAALALLCGLGAPAAEVLLNSLVPLWHYPQADLGGVLVSWVPWCYAFYTPAVGSLARYTWVTMRELEEHKAREAGAGGSSSSSSSSNNN